MSVKANAKKERLDMGKMEVSCLTLQVFWKHLLIIALDLDTRDIGNFMKRDIPLLEFTFDLCSTTNNYFFSIQ